MLILPRTARSVRLTSTNPRTIFGLNSASPVVKPTVPSQDPLRLQRTPPLHAIDTTHRPLDLVAQSTPLSHPSTIEIERALQQNHAVSSEPRRPRIVVLGTGWAGFRFIKQVDRKAFDVCCVSPRNHFVFTPLLASTTVGTLEFRTVTEPIRTVPHLQYFQANCTGIDVEKKLLHFQDVFVGKSFETPYDYLVISCGAKPNTFGVPGVAEHAHFLKDVNDARSIRQRILECFELASNPMIDDQERQRLLTFVCVGGGPTSVEFAGEFHDFVVEDVKKWYPPQITKLAKIILIEATDHILGSFDINMSNYVTNILQHRPDVVVRTNTLVKEVKSSEIELRNGERIPCGMVVWSTGITAHPLIKTLATSYQWKTEPRSGRLLVDDCLRVIGTENVFALGDCATPIAKSFPPTAQVAQQQGKYLAQAFNRDLNPTSATTPPSLTASKAPFRKLFVYSHRGMLAYVGSYRALYDLAEARSSFHLSVKGIGAWLLWRSAYFTYLMSVHNKILVPLYWMKSFFLGRDISRF